MSIVRDNLMSRPDYTPYCGGRHCSRMPRTHFNGRQFECSECGWQSGFDADFIEQYKHRWAQGDSADHAALRPEIEKNIRRIEKARAL